MIGPIVVRNLHEQVVQELGRLVVGGHLPREEVLAGRMKVSRTVLREAMKVLSAKGLIESRQRTGARVRDARRWNQFDADVLAWRCALLPAGDFVEKLLEMREAIELAAAVAAAQRHGDEQLRRIEAACDAMAAAADPATMASADLAFHEAVLHATGNELMISMFAVIGNALSACRASAVHTAGDVRLALPRRRKLLGAIRRRQPEAARRAMQEMLAEPRG
ncbi:GntR family transcriptional regulator [Rhodanobacter sp. C06]|uniref:FadR/GntR family transcriptional regulator n=1 Tax=Rhodanobacter sp. C06 TaxID=1945854 RepID=UPI00098735C4|nr:FCD domain-containing protein [Rhodanobacter sp. C06]OOG48311.1 GntR family transcriptional regulator [Rhodanobacter sp. C06]